MSWILNSEFKIPNSVYFSFIIRVQKPLITHLDLGCVLRQWSQREKERNRTEKAAKRWTHVSSSFFFFFGRLLNKFDVRLLFRSSFRSFESYALLEEIRSNSRETQHKYHLKGLSKEEKKKKQKQSITTGEVY